MTIHVKWLSSFFQKTLRWIKEFTNLKMDGHSKSNVTYTIYAYNGLSYTASNGVIWRNQKILWTRSISIISVFWFIVTFNPLGVEKNNDNARRNYFSSNHLNAPKEILLAEATLQKLVSHEREKRSYSKANLEYWENDIFAKRSRNEESQTQ